MTLDMAGARFCAWLALAKLYNQPPIKWGEGESLVLSLAVPDTELTFSDPFGASSGS